MAAERSQEDLIIAASVIVLALISFVAVLYLNRRSSGKGRRGAGTPTPVRSIPADGVGTVYVREGAQVVRRSTRQHKPMTPVAARISAAEDATPRTPKTQARTPGVAATPTSTRARRARA